MVAYILKLSIPESNLVFRVRILHLKIIELFLMFILVYFSKKFILVTDIT